MISLDYGQENSRFNLNKFLNWLLERKAYDALYKYALTRVNLFVTISIFKTLKEIDYTPQPYYTLWKEIENLLPVASDKPNQQILFNDSFLEGKNKTRSTLWVSEDGSQLAYIVMLFSDRDENYPVPHLKIVTSTPYNIQTIPLIYKEKSLDGSIKILGIDNDYAFLYAYRTSGSMIYKCLLKNNEIVECMPINAPSECYFYDNETHEICFFDRKEKNVKTANLLTNNCTATPFCLSDNDIIKEMKGIVPLKIINGFFLTTSRYKEGLRDKTAKAKVIISIDHHMAIHSIDNELACSTNGNYLLRMVQDVPGHLLLTVIDSKGNFRNILIDWTVSSSEPRIEIRTESPNVQRRRGVNSYAIGRRYKIMAIYHGGTHELRYYSTADNKLLFCFKIDKKIEAFDFIYNDQFLVMRISSDFEDTVYVSSIGYIVTCAKPPNMLDIEDVIRIKPLLAEKVFAEDSQLKLIVKLAEYFTIEKIKDESQLKFDFDKQV
jgi:hypothetical protein